MSDIQTLENVARGKFHKISRQNFTTPLAEKNGEQITPHFCRVVVLTFCPSWDIPRFSGILLCHIPYAWPTQRNYKEHSRRPGHNQEFGWFTFTQIARFSETGRIRFRRVRFQTPNSVSFLALTEFRGENSVSSS